MERLDQVDDQLGCVRCRLTRVVSSRVVFVVLDIVDRHVAAIRCRCFEIKSAEKRLFNLGVDCLQKYGGESLHIVSKLYMYKTSSAHT